MASRTGLRQASRTLQGERSHLTVSRASKLHGCSSHTLLSSRTTTFSRHSQIYSNHVQQQRRNLSWWGSGSSSSTASNASTQSNSLPQDLKVSEPVDFQNTITPNRSFKASQEFSSSEMNPEIASTHVPLEPQIVENVQQSMTEPLLSDGITPPADLEDMPERIGYFKEVCGLDYGWGTSSFCQFVAEHLHLTFGFSWTVSILLLGATVRAVVFPFLIPAARESQKLRDMKVVMDPIRQRYTDAKERQDQVKMNEAIQQMRALRDEFGLKMRRAFYPILLQIPLGFGAWRSLRAAATLPVPGFVSESWLWTTDLSFSDPYFITPMISSFLIWATIKTNARTNSNPQSENIMAILQKAMPALSLVFVSFQPGAVQLYFVSSSAVGLASAMILQNSAVRQYFKMPPLAPLPGAPNPSPSPSSSVMSFNTGSSTKSQVTPIIPPASPPVGGLQRRSLAARALEEEQAAAAAAAQTVQKERSSIDRGVDYVKGQASDLKGSWSKMKDQIGLGEKVEKAARKSQDAKALEYEARVKEKLDRQRRERNARSSQR